jgi:hypothetical protein
MNVAGEYVDEVTGTTAAGKLACCFLITQVQNKINHIEQMNKTV